MKQELLVRIKEIEDLAREEGLDFFPTIFEIVDKDIMLEACSYGLPKRGSHWSYGKSYIHQKIFGELGLSKIYEIVFNNNPAYAFLMNTNPDIINVMVAAHVYAHNHFFKNNVMFKNSDRNMVRRASERADRIDSYIEELGIEKVEHLMDIAFALDNHIDWDKGLRRKKYSKKRTVEKKIKFGEFEDIFGLSREPSRSVRKIIVGNRFPPSPEKDILWFLINYASLDDWERDILEIIREESYYFYPIVQTKILNEGFASFFHAELMYKYKGITEGEFIEFAKCHSGVINPGNPFNINPYYLGFMILTEVRKEWDKLHADGKSDIDGIQKVLEIAQNEDDASFLRNYLTKDLVCSLGLFNYGYKKKRTNKPDERITDQHHMIELKDRDLDKIIENILRPTFNYGAPLITIDEASGDTMVLRHQDVFGPLDAKYAEKTMEYIYELWGSAIELETYNFDKEKVKYCFDESGFCVV